MNEGMKIINNVKAILTVFGRNDNINLIINPDKVILEYYYDLKRERLCSTLDIRLEAKEILSKELEREVRDEIFTVTYSELANMKTYMGLRSVIYSILILEKQANYKNHTEEKVKQIKAKYKKGTRIQLIKMYDFLSPLDPYTRGTVNFVDDVGVIYMKWDNGSTLELIVGRDKFRILKEQ